MRMVLYHTLVFCNCTVGWASSRQQDCMVPPLVVGTPTSSSQSHGPLSAVGVLIYGLVRPMKWERWGTATEYPSGLDNSMQCFFHHGLCQAYNLYDEARDGKTLHWIIKWPVGVLDRPRYHSTIYQATFTDYCAYSCKHATIAYVIGGSSLLNSSWGWVGAGCHQGHLEGEEGSGRGSFYWRLDEEGKNNDICHLLKHALHYIWCY